MNNWHNYTKSLKINGQLFKAEQLLKIETFNLPDWEKEYYSFIRLWLNDDNYITVKTSGSTGKPKSIRILKNTFVNSALNTSQFLGLKKNDRILLCLPGNYIAGKMMIVRAFVSGFDLIWQKPSSSPIINRKFNFSAMTPMQVQNIISRDKNELNSIQTIIIGGAPVSNDLINQLSKLSSKFYETYGMTETASHISLKLLVGNKKSEYFKVLKGINIGLDERNCLTIKSSYLQINDLITNDLVKIKGSSKFKWLGRIDNIINSGGIKLIPETIENKLKKLIEDDFYISSLPDKLLTNHLILIIESLPKSIDIDFNLYLDKYEIPKKIFFINQFIRTKSGKIKRRETSSLLFKNT